MSSAFFYSRENKSKAGNEKYPSADRPPHAVKEPDQKACRGEKKIPIKTERVRSTPARNGTAGTKRERKNTESKRESHVRICYNNTSTKSQGDR